MTPAEIRNAITDAWHQGYKTGRDHGREEAQRDESRRDQARVHADVCVHNLARQYGLDTEDA